MNKHLKLITALLSIILCLSVFTLTASALDADGDGYDDETGEYIGVVTEPVYTDPIIYTDPVYTEPVYTDPIIYTDPVYTEPVYVEPETEYVYTEPVYDDNINDDYSDYDDSQSSDSYNDYDFDTEYDIDYSDDSYQDLTPTSPLYESDREIDDSELSKSDWDYIKANLSNADSSADDGSDSFDFIKKNDSKGDNGDWMLIVGIVCILLSIAGITYVIASAVIRRKKIKSGAYTKQPAYAGASASRYRSDDYGDGYRTSKSEKKKLDRSRKYDTADVVLPKNSSRNKNGRRYK